MAVLSLNMIFWGLPFDLLIYLLENVTNEQMVEWNIDILIHSHWFKWEAISDRNYKTPRRNHDRVLVYFQGSALKTTKMSSLHIF